MNSKIDWNLIQTFLTVAEEGSLLAAGKRLGLSQPTVGRHIQTLEDHFKVVLFDRHLRGVHLTAQGALLVPLARQMQQVAAKTQMLYPELEDGGRAVVRLTAPMWISHHVLPQMLFRFRQRHPQIEIELVATDAAENLLFRAADIAIRTFATTQLDIVTRSAALMQIAPIAAKSYLDRHGRPERPEALLDYHLIGFDQNDEIIEAMREFGWQATPQDFLIRVDNQIIYWELIRQGHGIGFGARAAALRDPALEVVLGHLPIEKIPLWLAAHERILDIPAVAQLWHYLADELGAYFRFENPAT